MQNFEIRVLLKFFWKKGLSARAAAREICSEEGEGSVSNPTASAWFKKFNTGDTSIEDQPRSGRPPTLDSEVLRQSVEANPAPGDCQANLGFQNPPSLANSTSLERSTSAAEKCPTN